MDIISIVSIPADVNAKVVGRAFAGRTDLRNLIDRLPRVSTAGIHRVAAILPMAFVRGLTGPYMRPIPVGASAAMAFSLVVAFVVTPWAAVRMLKPSAAHDRGTEDRLIASAQAFVKVLMDKKIPFTYSQSGGGHNAPYWTREVGVSMAVQYAIMQRNLKTPAKTAAAREEK